MIENTKIQTLNLSQTLSLFLYLTSFAIPFFFPGPQIITGSIINALLIFTALQVRTKHSFVPSYLPILFLPSLATIIRGLIFGPFTPLLFYMLPFIWLGNAALVFGIRYGQSRNINYFSNLFFSIMLKTFILYTIAYFWVSVHILPSLFLTSMGLIQFLTAAIGGVIVWLLLKSKPFGKF